MQVLYLNIEGLSSDNHGTFYHYNSVTGCDEHTHSRQAGQQASNEDIREKNKQQRRGPEGESTFHFPSHRSSRGQTLSAARVVPSAQRHAGHDLRIAHTPKSILSILGHDIPEIRNIPSGHRTNRDSLLGHYGPGGGAALCMHE